MDTNLLDEYSKQMKDWQQEVFKTWTASFPGGSNEKNFSSTWETAINLQQDWVNAALKAQEIGINIALGAQQELWRSYFDLLRNSSYLKYDEHKS